MMKSAAESVFETHAKAPSGAPEEVVTGVHPIARVDAAASSITSAPVPWGAVFAGTLTATGVELAVGLVGLALGLTAWSLLGAEYPGVLSLAAAGWLALTAITGMFLAGFVAAKQGSARAPLDQAITGILTWSSGAIAAAIGVWGIATAMGPSRFWDVAARLLGSAPLSAWYGILIVAATAIATAMGILLAASLVQGSGVHQADPSHI
ncbi:MAG: hypothetical protein HY898_14945 [Deltaproteobacteria bacterium]|nr:hypothetical protein [Deltaproteobacteria bacterium]